MDQGKYYAVDSDGYMVVDNTVYVSNYYAVGDGVYGTVRAGKDGVLVKGWYTNSSKTTYYFGDNYFAYGTGLYTIEGKQYYFQYESLVKSRSFVYDGKVYIADANGVVTLIDTTGQTKWVELNGAWYYLKDGVALTNTLKEIDGSYYYFNESGEMLSSRTFEYNNHKYYANSDGVVAMKKNTWAQTDDGQTIYYKEDGSLVYNTTFTIDNKLYKFSYDGYLECGSISVYDKDGAKYYITDESGAINQTAGWKEYRFHWYYAKEGGALYTNELKIIDGKSYYFDYSGQMVVNTAKYVGNGLCYFDTNGQLVDTVVDFTGTKEFHGLTYLNKDGDFCYTGEYGGRYFSNGIMLQNCIVEDKYYVDFNGKIVKGWIKNGDTYYYADSTTGVLVKNKRLQINGTTYYFKGFANGKKVELVAKTNDKQFDFIVTYPVVCTNHDWDEGVITTEPTCTTKGVKTFTCKNCKTTKTEEVNALDHDYSKNWTIDKKATCTEEGSKSHHCTRCDSKKDVTIISKTSHNYDEGVITKEATKTETGIKTYTCKDCKTTKTEVIPKRNDDFNVDSQSPVIDKNSIKLNANTFTEGDTLKVYAKITDNVGIASAVVILKNNDTNKSIQIRKPIYHENNGLYEFSMKIDDQIPNGHWYLEGVQAYDAADNLGIFVFDSDEYSFIVKDSKVDSESPVIDLTSIKLNANTFTEGDTLKVYAKITDNVGIASTVVILKNNDTNKSIQIRVIRN